MGGTGILPVWPRAGRPYHPTIIVPLIHALALRDLSGTNSVPRAPDLGRGVALQHVGTYPPSKLGGSQAEWPPTLRCRVRPVLLCRSTLSPGLLCDSFCRMVTGDTSPKASSSRPQHRAGLALLAVLAAGALLARHADGTVALPTWLEIVLQVPILLAWCHWRCGTFGTEQSRVADRWLTLLVMAGGAVWAIVGSRVEVFFAATTTFIAGTLLMDALSTLYRRVDRLIIEPTHLLRTLVGSWLLLILAATLLLSIPLATHSAVPDYRHNFWDHALSSAFAAVSSACLVGTTVYSFGEEYSRFGQIVLVVTTQLAGAGLAVLGLAIVQPFLNKIIRLRTVLLLSFGLQVLAVLIMWSSWETRDAATVGDRCWWGIVHAGSALWNSGMTLRNDGLAAYISNGAVFACITTLAIIGSLGLPVILDLVNGKPRQEVEVWHRRPGGESTGETPVPHGKGESTGETPVPHGKGESTGETPVPRGKGESTDATPVSQRVRTADPGVETESETKERPPSNPPWRKLSQWETAAAFLLLLIGAVALFYCETPWSEGIVWRLPDSWVPQRPVDFGSNLISLRDDMPYRARWTMSVFTSATLRSAGLQSTVLSQGSMSWPSYGLYLAWMIIGGSAGGVAGGMRMSVLLLIGICLFSRRRSWSSWPGGEPGRRMLLRAFLLFVPLWLAFNVVSIGLLAATRDGYWYEVILESVSACNSVGLSTGLSLHLTPAARMAMILIIITGRVIPVAYWLSVSRRFTQCLRTCSA